MKTEHYPLLKELLPPISYQPQPGGLLDAQLQAEARQHDLAFMHINSVLNAINPATSGDLIVLWEKELAITPDVGQTYQQRVQSVIAKLNETGGLSIPYFINLAKKAGYQIEIREPQPFRAGSSRCGDPLYIKEIIWVWHVQVNSKARQIWQFRAGMSTAGERLSSFSDPVIEEMFQKLKPAHTLCVFFYKNEDD